MALIDTDQVAAKLRRRPSYFRKLHPRLRRENGFPDPIMRGLWDEQMVDKWIAAGGLNPHHADTPQAAVLEEPPEPRPGRPRQLDDARRQRQANRDLDRLP